MHPLFMRFFLYAQKLGLSYRRQQKGIGSWCMVPYAREGGLQNTGAMKSVENGGGV